MGTDERQAERKAFFNQHAQGWVDRNYPPEKLRQVEQLVASLPLQAGQRLVDVGCGQGILLPYLRNHAGESGIIVALDPSPEMLAHVPQRDAQAWPLLATAENIPLLPDWADMVICFSAFPHIGDKEAAAREFYRVLKPGGLVFVLHIDGRARLNQLHDQHQAVCGDHLPCPIGMQKIFGAAGFTAMQVDDAEDHYYFSARKQAEHD